MPSYEYECRVCSVVFDELHLSRSSAERHKDAFPCPKCGKDADRAFVTPSSFKFMGGVQGTSGVNGNSGVHDLDYPSLDKAVARSSEARWKFHGERQAAMRESESKSEVGLSTMTPDGTIAPMAKDAKASRDAGATLVRSLKSE